VNGGDIKANLRGLKNKPGSTRPVDITDSLRLRPASYGNNIELTYALTQKVREAPHSKKGLEV
jgi:E3 SUMO-protein ligase PIAS1